MARLQKLGLRAVKPIGSAGYGQVWQVVSPGGQSRAVKRQPSSCARHEYDMACLAAGTGIIPVVSYHEVGPWGFMVMAPGSGSVRASLPLQERVS